MNAIRWGASLALVAVMAGCSATVGPDAIVVGQTLPDTKAKAEKPPEKAADLPEKIAAVPVETVPQVEVQPVYTPVPAPVVPLSEYVSIDTPAPPAPQPVYESVAVAAPEFVPERQPERVVVVPAQPVYEAVAEPVAADPSYVVDTRIEGQRLATRSMSPIRDDPQDGNVRSRAENTIHRNKGYVRNAALRAGGLKPKIRSNFTPDFGRRLEAAALGRLNPAIRYDARYVSIGYPWGDVPETTGVCSDVIIRSYRALGIDLQTLVHEDMNRAFKAYPSRRIYGLKKADPNIDHRRVVNLEAFFERTGASIPVGTSPDDFQPGDVLTWRLSGNEPHTGIVVADRDPRSGYPLVVHNLGAGVRKDDLITLSTPTGHFRFAPDETTQLASLQAPR